MTFEIITPDGNKIEVEAQHNDPYLKDLEARGYKVSKKLNVCTSCEG